ncbi:GNAT family N-acetyltransferase [Methanoplanus endosymbiosus]|uniref:GNAT family N-acetyltransferase n=1 Tax=Methanoplanus endosymbiosus TaxID=33865 RepID=A0A9E7TIN8_9EURY|nr:GNAT family N-acetyltransferase [Methanoplanus endosymbiosus]UUX92743.1 GNAT family N-acetyltransferase [Methanoplanus endosymbiosus]
MPDDEKIEIRFVEEWNTSEIIELYRQGNWWKEEWDKMGILPLISGSFLFAVAYSVRQNKAVGMGRVISDGVSDGYIQDLVILKDYRGKGLGKTVLKSLVDESVKRGLSWIGLIAEPDTEDFYRMEGFEIMNGHTPMIYTRW